METPTEAGNLPASPGPSETLASDATKRNPRGKVPEAVLESVLEALNGLKFGQVTVTVQDGYVVQIERLDRRRIRS